MLTSARIRCSFCIRICRNDRFATGTGIPPHWSGSETLQGASDTVGLEHEVPSCRQLCQFHSYLFRCGVNCLLQFSICRKCIRASVAGICHFLCTDRVKAIMYSIASWFMNSFTRLVRFVDRSNRYSSQTLPAHDLVIVSCMK